MAPTPPVLACGIAEWRTNPPPMPHRLPCYLIMSTSEGEQILEVDGQQWTLPAGRLMVIPPGVNHRTWSDIPRRTLWVRFDVMWQAGREHRSEVRTCEPPANGPEDFMQPSPQAVWGVISPQQPSSGLIVNSSSPSRALARRQVRRPTRGQSPTHHPAGQITSTTTRPSTPVVTDDRIAHAERIALTMLDQPFGVADFAAAAQLPHPFRRRLPPTTR